MVIELVSYNISIFNPLLKIAITVGFAIAAGLFYQCSRRYGGIMHQISLLLFIATFCATFSAFFRFQGDFLITYKWVESLVGLFVSIILLIIAVIIRKKILMIQSLFDGNEGP